MFDVTVVSPWPQGLYLCWKFKKSGKKVCYIETPSSSHQPVSLFLDESGEEDIKSFLLSQGFLEKQEGGFCLVSEQGVWSFQETDSLDPVLNNYREGKKAGLFKENWISFFAHSYKSRLFEYNNSCFSGRPLNLFGDYFLFKPSFEKKRQFREDNPDISWLEVNSSELKNQNSGLFIKDSSHNSKKNFLFHQPSYETCLPDWLWDHFVFEGDLKDYEEVVPSHFVMIHQIPIPWTHSNLLSVFRRQKEWDVWFRRPFRADSKEKEKLKKEIVCHLENFFKIPFCFVKEGERSGFAVYGEESLAVLKKQCPFVIRWQEDLVQQLQMEEEIFKSSSDL